MIQRRFILFAFLILCCLTLTGCSVLSDLGNDIAGLFTGLGAGFIHVIAEGSKIVSSIIALPEAFLMGLKEIEYGYTYGGCLYQLSSMQSQARQAAYKNNSFMYHYPVAKGWANLIATDPLMVTNSIVSYFEDIITGPWPVAGTATPDSQNLAWGSMPDDAGSGLSIGVPMVALVASNGNINTTNESPGTIAENFTFAAGGDNTLLASLVADSPYTGPGMFSCLDYLFLPFSYAVSLCATNPQAWQNVCAILFSQPMFNLYQQMDVFLANPNYSASFNYTLNGVVTIWNPATPGEFFLRVIGRVVRASLGPAYFVPYPGEEYTTDIWTQPNPAVPPVTDSFNVLASYLLGSEALGNYMNSLTDAATVATAVISLTQGTNAPPGVIAAIPNPNIPKLPTFTFAQSQGIKLAGALIIGSVATAVASRAKESE